MFFSLFSIALFFIPTEANLYYNGILAYIQFKGVSNELGGRKMLQTSAKSTDDEVLPNLNWSFPTATDKIAEHNVCGQSSFNHMKRIVGGKDAEEGDWPWAAALGYQDETGDVRYRCGGTLITAQHVLTAAHCVQIPKNDRFQLKGVLLGVIDLRKGSQKSFQVIKEAYAHEDYSPDTHANDIALLTLETPVNFTGNVRAACLPLFPWPGPIRDSSKHQSYVAGWGALHYGGSNPSILKWTDMPLLNASFCETAYESRSQVTDSRMICAGFIDGSKDACQGDSGGGLVWRDVDTYYVIGVVSYGYECARKDYPGVYIQVSNYTDWILDVINK